MRSSPMSRWNAWASRRAITLRCIPMTTSTCRSRPMTPIRPRCGLQDAVPVTLGQEFDAFFITIKEDVSRIREAAALFREVNLGATAIGTGINADPRYAALAIE